MVFTASLDKLAKGITIAVSLFFIFFIITNVVAYLNRPHLLPLISSILLLLVLGGCYLFSVRAYELTEVELIIHRPLKNKVIFLNEIENVKTMEKGLKGTIRTFGVGGLFGYFGRFYSLKIGATTWYATKRKGMVLLGLRNGIKLVVTPDNVTDFVRELLQKKASGRIIVPT